MILAIDFDGTLVDHQFPDIGTPVPQAFEYLREFQKLGAQLILWTMRNDAEWHGPVLTQAVEFCRQQGVEFWGVNENPTQNSWTQSPKAYAHLYIDGAGFNCPMRENPRMGGRPFVDWTIVGPRVMQLLLNELAGQDAQEQTFDND